MIGLRTTLDDCRQIHLPKIQDGRGGLSFIEGGRHIPFDIARVYYLYDVPGGEARAAHGHKYLQQFLVCLVGSCDVQVDDGRERRKVALNSPSSGLYVPRLIWLRIDNFSAGAICLVLASHRYDQEEYLQDYDAFKAYKLRAEAP